MAASILLRMTAKLQAVFQLHVAKNTEKKRKPKILTFSAFHASFADKDRNFMVSNTIVISLL